MAGRGAPGPPPTSPPGTYRLFRSLFAGAPLEADDLLLLEPFQISYLPGWAPARELGTLLRARPYLYVCLSRRCPQAAPFLDEARALGLDRPSAEELARCEEQVVWTIADLLVYNRCPQVYDDLPFHAWPFTEVTDLVDLGGKVVMDGGAGTGRVALEAAQHAAVVWAVEPVGRLRHFIREKARALCLHNVHVVDGLLHDLPFPPASFDVVITSHPLGWRLDAELAELERVVRRPGVLLHCPGTAATPGDEPQHAALVSARWAYQWAPMQEADGPKRKYWKALTPPARARPGCRPRRSGRGAPPR
ncbi:MAG: class I SAM-dependent methyltransferase [Candidatus Latescibacterota bacterium]